MRHFNLNPDNIKRAAAERPERLVRMLPSASSEVREELFEALAAAGNLDAALVPGAAQVDAIVYALDNALEVLVEHARHADLETVEQIVLLLLDSHEDRAALDVATARGEKWWVVADDSGNQLEYRASDWRAREAGEDYVLTGEWGDDPPEIDVRVWPRFKVLSAEVDNREEYLWFSVDPDPSAGDDAKVEDDEMPQQEGLFCAQLHGTIAIVYQPKLKQLMRVEAHSTKSIDLFFGSSERGHAYLDSETMGDCARTHSAGSGVTVGTGDGMALYTGLAALAYQGCERECIGSCPKSQKYGPRTPLADEWWKRARARGLTEDAGGGCLSISLERLIRSGLVFWMADDGDYAGLIASAQEKYAAAFAAAESDPESLDLIREQLGNLLAASSMQEWLAAHLPDAAKATPNRRSGRRAKRKPAFVTPELEAHVEDLYAGLEGL